LMQQLPRCLRLNIRWAKSMLIRLRGLA